MLSEGVGSPCATDGANHHVSIWVLGLNPGPIGRAASCPIPFGPSLQLEYIQPLSHTKASESLFWRHQTGNGHYRLSTLPELFLSPQMDLTNLPSHLLHVLPSSKDTILLSARGNASMVWKFFCFFKTSSAGTLFWNQLHIAAPSCMTVFLPGKGCTFPWLSTGGCWSACPSGQVPWPQPFFAELQNPAHTRCDSVTPEPAVYCMSSIMPARTLLSWICSVPMLTR